VKEVKDAKEVKDEEGSCTMFRLKRISLVASLMGAFATVALAGPRKVIIDTDPGTDDAMAIMLALNSPEFDVRALTVVPGNVTAAQGLENALRMVSLANRCDIVVAGGARDVSAGMWGAVLAAVEEALT